MAAPALTDEDRFQLVLRLADSPLVLAQRVSELVGAAPLLEEEMATANCALDLLGQATMLLEYAAEISPEGGQTADGLAFHRDARDFRNLLLCELPNGDFAHTMLRLAIASNIFGMRWEALASSADDRLAAIARRSATENAYHRRHAEGWVERLAGGTEESRLRTQQALEVLWPYAGEGWLQDPLDERAAAAGILDLGMAGADWELEAFEQRLAGWGLQPPAVEYMQRGGHQGLHTEALGHLLAEMQWLPRAMPEASW